MFKVFAFEYVVYSYMESINQKPHENCFWFEHRKKKLIIVKYHGHVFAPLFLRIVSDIIAGDEIPGWTKNCTVVHGIQNKEVALWEKCRRIKTTRDNNVRQWRLRR